MTRKQKDRRSSANEDRQTCRTGGPTDMANRLGVRSRSGRCKPESLTPSQTGGARLQFPPGEADIEDLRSVTREWLVPRLVEKFLRVHGVDLKHSRQHANRLPSSHVEDSASAVAKEIRSQAKQKKPIPGT
jgi:hypothetical protein